MAEDIKKEIQRVARTVIVAEPNLSAFGVTIKFVPLIETSAKVLSETLTE